MYIEALIKALERSHSADEWFSEAFIRLIQWQQRLLKLENSHSQPHWSFPFKMAPPFGPLACELGDAFQKSNFVEAFTMDGHLQALSSIINQQPNFPSHPVDTPARMAEFIKAFEMDPPVLGMGTLVSHDPVSHAFRIATPRGHKLTS